MRTKKSALIVLFVLVVLGVLAWRPVSNFIQDDRCLDSGGKVGPHHSCVH